MPTHVVLVYYAQAFRTVSAPLAEAGKQCTHLREHGSMLCMHRQADVL